MKNTINSKQISELAWWHNQIIELGHDGLATKRKGLYADRCGHFPDLEKQIGLGLDVGCGPRSHFEGSDKNVIAIDPLLDEYKELTNLDTNKISYITTIDERIPFADSFFDWLYCVNVIDHTPDPHKLACEMTRVLKIGGRLFFHVYFVDELTDSHYKIFNRDVVDDVLIGFTEQDSHVDGPSFYGTYIK